MVDELTDEIKKAGAELIQRMDARGCPPDAAFWLYDQESEMWKLVIAEANTAGSGPGYRQIQKLLGQPGPGIEGVTLADISLVTPSFPLVLLLGRVVKTPAGISGIRFRNMVVNGTVIQDAYIYRLR